MISINELVEVSKKRKTNLYYEEKEYLQYIFLNAISNYADKFVFKGGTCLRICFDLERASEDLDFSTILSVKEAKEIIYKCLKDFELLGINYGISSEKEFEGNWRIEIRIEGPLFVGKRQSINSLKIDFNKQEIKYKDAKVVQKLFSDVPLFTIYVLGEKEILAEKIRALVRRGDAKDLYDVWMLLNKGIEIDKKLLSWKLKQEKTTLFKLKFPSKEEYEVGLKNFVSFLPSYEQVRRDVEAMIEKIKLSR